MRNLLASVFYKLAIKFKPQIEDVMVEGMRSLIEKKKEAEDTTPWYIKDQTPKVVEKMGWTYVPYSPEDKVRVTITKSNNDTVRAVVDICGVSAHQISTDTMAKGALGAMEVVDILEKAIEAQLATADED